MTQKLIIDFLKNRYLIFWGKNAKEIMILLVKLIINNKDHIALINAEKHNIYYYCYYY